MAKVLIIDDDELICEMLSLMVEDMGHTPSYTLTIEEGFKRASSEEFDVIFLDIRMPDGNGLDLIRYIKKRSISLGIIIISALISLENRIEGLEIGADNYLTKPFHLAELNAHLKSINRRISFGGNNQIILNEIRLIPDEHKAFVNDNEITLTKKEYELLLFFISNRNKVITKAGLAEHLWGDYMDLADSYDFIYTHIKNLRAKLLKNGCEDYIRTIYGLGYKFDLT